MGDGVAEGAGGSHVDFLAARDFDGWRGERRVSGRSMRRGGGGGVDGAR